MSNGVPVGWQDQPVQREVSSWSAGWALVLPVQRAGRAKSRLVAPDGVDHEALARAIALDSLAAVRGSNLVGHRVVVTSDEVVGPAAAGAGDTVLVDPGSGLSAAIRLAVSHVVKALPGTPVAVLLADVPALHAAQLTEALRAVSVHRSAFVPDAEGTGTVLLAARDPADLRPAFGAESASRHEQGGATRLVLALPRLRRDVDTAAALAQAVELGVGPATRAALGR